MWNILEYLEKTEMMYPHHTAVDDGKFVLTWKELAELSRQMGTAFVKKVRHGKPVAILAEKRAATLAAMFGSVYAGGFYVVIDPAQPANRIQEILNVLEPDLVVINEKTGEVLKQTDYQGNTYRIEDGMLEKEDWDLLWKIREHS